MPKRIALDLSRELPEVAPYNSPFRTLQCIKRYNHLLQPFVTTICCNNNREESHVSLFGNNQYQYRETYFVLFPAANLPSADKVEQVLSGLGPRYETLERLENEQGLESITVKSPRDFSAMDIVLTSGEEVVIQIHEVQDAARTMTLSSDDMKKLVQLKNFDARFDIFHFEEVATATEDDQFLDPGGLLMVLESLAELCGGVALDPQTLSIM